MTKDEWYRQLFELLDNSKFRSSFHLKQKDIDYINEKGLDTIRQHAKAVSYTHLDVYKRQESGSAYFEGRYILLSENCG